MVCSGLMGALTRLLREARRIAEEKGLTLEETVRMLLSELEAGGETP